MLYIRPTREGYEAFDIYHHPVFSESDCRHLFSFIEANTSALQEKLGEYFFLRINSDSLEMNEGKVPDRLVKGIKKEMDQIHPYLSTNHYFTVFAMLAEHLNSCIYAHDSEKVPSIEEYGALLRHLVQPLYTIGAEPLRPSTVPTSAEFAAKYHKQLESLYQKPVRLSGLDYIEAVRSEADRYVFWILDQSSFRFKDLDRSSRVRLYSRIFRNTAVGADMRFVSNFYWKEPEEYDYYAHTREGRLMEDIFSNKTFDDRVLEEREHEHRLKMAQYLTLLHSDRQELTDELKEFMDEEITSAREDQAATLFEEYRVDNFYQLIQLQLWLLTKGDTIIKRCRHCGRLFIAERQSVDYCSRVAEGETEPCDIVGPRKSFAKLMDEDHILKDYNRVYKTMYARMKRGTLSADEFNSWKAQARSMLDKTRAGEVREDAFEIWLRQDIRSWGIGRTEPSGVASPKLGEE
jgi:hypothetical protein